jgi:hypothetical protein
MRSKHVSGYRRGKIASKFFVIRSAIGSINSLQITKQGRGNYLPILDVHHPLCVRITEITLVWWSVMDLGFIQGVGDLIGKHACGDKR